MCAVFSHELTLCEMQPTQHFFGTTKQPCPSGKRFISITFTTTFYSLLVALVSRHHTIRLLIYLIVYLITRIYHTTASLDLLAVFSIFYICICQHTNFLEFRLISP